MFTGIIEELGMVVKLQNYSGLLRITVSADKALVETKVGDSIAVNGVCLTVTKIENKNLSFEVMAETLKNTTLGDLRLREKVNLERALKFSDRVNGHFVSGHIDAVGVIRSKKIVSQNTIFEIGVDKKLVKYISPKGSIAVDGISLTIGEVKGNGFSVYLIPHTLKNTTLGFKSHSDKVNIEVDMTAKQLDSLLRK
ncbi:MAG: riboflavin synthase [Candidatus Omnitrophota bacterium]|nr:riboflavin synthase [Candidatus Omnitrophota bacterium]